MVETKEKEERKWYVMRTYKQERTAEERLSDSYGMEHFIPKHEVLRTRNGRKVLCLEPVIHNLIFVHATQKQIVHFKQYYYNDLQFVTFKRDGHIAYLTVLAKEMESFITVCLQKVKPVTYYTPAQLAQPDGKLDLTQGKRIRVHGGPFDQVEGYFMKVAKKRGRQLVVIIPDLLVVSAEVEPDFIEFI